MKRAVLLTMVMVFLLVLSCVMTDDQIKNIADQVGNAAETGALIGAPALGIDTGAAAGLAGAIGVAIAFLTKTVLTAIRKKSS